MTLFWLHHNCLVSSFAQSKLFKCFNQLTTLFWLHPNCLVIFFAQSKLFKCFNQLTNNDNDNKLPFLGSSPPTGAWIIMGFVGQFQHKQDALYFFLLQLCQILQTLYFKNLSLDKTLSDFPAGKPQYVQTAPVGRILGFNPKSLTNSGIVWKFAHWEVLWVIRLSDYPDYPQNHAREFFSAQPLRLFHFLS